MNQPSSLLAQATKWMFLVVFATSISCRGGGDRPAAVPRSLPDNVRAQPMVVRTDDGRETRFQRLTSAETGIDFVHQWTPPESYAHDLETMMAGGGVAIGDLDGASSPISVSTPSTTRPATIRIDCFMVSSTTVA